MPGEDELDTNDGLDETLPPNEGDDEALEADDETGDADSGEGSDEGEDEEAPAVDAGAARKPNRAQARIQTLTQTAREANERATRLEREFNEFKAAQARSASAPQQESAQERAVRRATLAPEEVMREDLRDSETRTQGMLRQIQMEQRETSDRTTYHEIMRENPALKRYGTEVERIRVEQSAAGNFVPREAILDLVIGRAARAAAKTKRPQAVQQAQRQKAQQTTQPARSRGDTATARGRQGDSLESRLADVPI